MIDCHCKYGRRYDSGCCSTTIFELDTLLYLMRNEIVMLQQRINNYLTLDFDGPLSKHTSKCDDIKAYMKILEEEKIILYLGLKSCLKADMLCKIIEKAKRLLHTVGIGPYRKDIKVEKIPVDMKANPCLNLDDWNRNVLDTCKVIYGLSFIPNYISLESTGGEPTSLAADKSQFVYNFRTEQIPCGTLHKVQMDLQRCEIQHELEYVPGCDLTYDMEVKKVCDKFGYILDFESDICQLTHEYGLNYQKCVLEYLTQVQPKCNVTYDTYAKLISCGLSNDTITALFNCKLANAIEIIEKCIYLKLNNGLYDIRNMAIDINYLIEHCDELGLII